MLNRYFSNVPQSDLPVIMNWTDLIFFTNSWQYRGKIWELDFTIFFQTGDIYLKIHSVCLMGLKESSMVHRLWINNAKISLLYVSEIWQSWPDLDCSKLIEFYHEFISTVRVKRDSVVEEISLIMWIFWQNLIWILVGTTRLNEPQNFGQYC